jgi:hypothetical protein
MERGVLKHLHSTDLQKNDNTVPRENFFLKTYEKPYIFLKSSFSAKLIEVAIVYEQTRTKHENR